MSVNLSRRNLLQAAGALALSPAALAACSKSGWPPTEDSGTPKLCLGIASNAAEAQMRKLRQIGVNHVLMGGPRIPWKESELRARLGRFKANGLVIANLMIGGFRNTLYARPGRDEEIAKVIQSFRDAG